MGAIPLGGVGLVGGLRRTADGTFHCHAAGRFQRTAEPRQRFLRQGGDDQGPGHRRAVFRQCHSQGPAQPERHRHPQRLPVPNLATPIGGNGNWFAARLHTQHQRKDTLSSDMNVTEKHRLQFRRSTFSVSRIPAARREHRPHAEVLRPPQPDQLTQLRLDRAAHDGERGAAHGQPGPRLHPGGHGELLRPHAGGHQLPVHLSRRAS